MTVQAEVLDLWRELRDERGLGMILVTHNLGVVADLCDTVSVMKDARIVESGDVRAIFGCAHPYTQRLQLATPVPDPDIQAWRRRARRELLEAGA